MCNVVAGDGGIKHLVTLREEHCLRQDELKEQDGTALNRATCPAGADPVLVEFAGAAGKPRQQGHEVRSAD